MWDCCTAFCDSFVTKDRAMFVKNIKRIRNRERQSCRRCKKIVEHIDNNNKEGARELIEILLALESRKFVKNYIEQKQKDKPVKESVCNEITICMKCKNKREYYAKGYCRYCYNVVRKNKNYGCNDCGKGKHYGVGYCVTCYCRHSKRERGKKKNGE